MRDINLEVYFWREAIADYIKENYTETFVQWYDFLFKELSGERKREFIFLLNAVFNRYISIGDLHKWFICFFDKEERTSESDLESLLVEFGLGNILYYKSTGGYEENRFVPTIFQEHLYKKFKGEFPVEEEQVEEFLIIYP